MLQAQAHELTQVLATTQDSEAALRCQIGPMEEGLLTITTRFRQLHDHMNVVVKGAASFGNHLQVLLGGCAFCFFKEI